MRIGRPMSHTGSNTMATSTSGFFASSIMDGDCPDPCLAKKLGNSIFPLCPRLSQVTCTRPAIHARLGSYPRQIRLALTESLHPILIHKHVEVEEDFLVHRDFEFLAGEAADVFDLACALTDEHPLMPVVGGEDGGLDVDEGVAGLVLSVFDNLDLDGRGVRRSEEHTSELQSR